MKTLATILATLSVFAVAVWLYGCSSSKSNPTSTGTTVSETPKIIVADPADGSTGVTPSASIGMQFNEAMDTASVRLGFHLAGGPQMHMWLDSLENPQGMHGMMMNMGHMMDWMDTIQMTGSFHWDEDLDSCWFVPDSNLHPNTDYIYFMYGHMAGQNGMMWNVDSVSDVENGIISFTTGS